MRSPASLPGAAVGILVTGWVVCASAAGLEGPVPGHSASALTLRPIVCHGGYDGRPRNLYESNHRNRRVGAFAWGLATAAILLEEPRYLEVAQRQIQWIVGLNPADVSMMAGVGKGPGCYHHRYCFMEGCEAGVVSGGILNGIESGNGNVVYMGDLDTKNFVIAEVPPDYPLFDTDVWGWTYAYATNEYWARNSAWFVMGAFQVEKALGEQLH